MKQQDNDLRDDVRFAPGSIEQIRDALRNALRTYKSFPLASLLYCKWRPLVMSYDTIETARMNQLLEYHRVALKFSRGNEAF